MLRAVAGRELKTLKICQHETLDRIQKIIYFSVFLSVPFILHTLKKSILMSSIVFIYSLNLYPSQDKEYNFTWIVFTEDQTN